MINIGSTSILTGTHSSTLPINVLLCCDINYLVLFLICNHLSDEEKAQVALLFLCSCCHVTVYVLCRTLRVPLVCVLPVIVDFPAHTHMFLKKTKNEKQI